MHRSLASTAEMYETVYRGESFSSRDHVYDSTLWNIKFNVFISYFKKFHSWKYAIITFFYGKQ